MRKLVLLVVFGALLVIPSPAQATPPSDVQIQIDTILPPSGAPFGRFTATGPVCPTGDSVDVFDLGAGSQSGTGIQLLVGKQFTCDDGTGTFLLLLRVHIVFQPFSDTFTWSVLSGTGAYEKLHGSGTGFGVPTPTGVFDTFTGGMHID
jgi:hypothetical protein